MNNPSTFNPAQTLSEIREKESKILELDEQISKLKYELQELKKLNAANVTIPLKESIKNCLFDENIQPSYFLKTPAFVSNCVAWNYGVDPTRELKNKIATTLSIMFSQGLIGRIQHNGKTYYGLPNFFKTDLTTLKRDFVDWLEDLIP